MRHSRSFIYRSICVAALALLMHIVPARAAGFVVTESHTHSFRPGDNRDTALEFARWGAVDKAMGNVVVAIKEEGGLPVMETGLEAIILKSAIVAEPDSLKCSKDKCTVSVTAVVDTGRAIGAIEGILARPDMLGQFLIAQAEGRDALKEAGKLSVQVAGGDPSARKQYEQAVFRGFAWNWYFLGSALSLASRDFEALEAFDRFLGLMPGFAGAYLSRGTVYAKLGRHDMALADYDRAVALSPEDPQAYNNRGVARYNLKDYRRAALDFTRAIERAPMMALAYNNRGNAYLDSGDPDAAILDYNKAVELDPGYAEAYNSRGTAYNALKKPEQALADFTRATELDPDYPDAFNNRGVTLHGKGRLKEAIEDYGRAIRLNATNAEAHNNRGVAFQQQGELKKAHGDYSSAIALSPDYLGAYMNRALLNMKVKNSAQACSDAREACRLGDCRVRDAFSRDGKCK